MEIVLTRIAKKKEYTIGKIYINGAYFCDSLEDTDRGLTSDMSIAEIAKRKVAGKTAIPTGRYRVRVTYSPRFRQMMPILEGVRGFQGIRIHTGNTAKDTDGCLLVGKNKKVGMVLESRATYELLYKKIVKSSETWITIK